MPTARIVATVGVPVVNLRSTLPELSFPFIGADNRAIAHLAVGHLLERGFKQFAFCGFRRGYHRGFDLRRESFKDLIEKAAYPCQQLILRGQNLRPPSWEKEQARIVEWLHSLPLPVGIMAVNDECGLQVLDACRRGGLSVPDQVAVIGCDNDEYACSLSIPPLSSIDLNSERVGYEAAVLLDRLMAGKRTPKRLPEIQPSGVITRRSTDVLATDDAAVIRAVDFIRRQACRPITVMDVVKYVQVPRTTLQIRVSRVIGRTIHQEIRRVQIVKAKELLSGANVPIKRVAHECGFVNVQYFTQAFQRATGLPPGRFKRAHWSGQERIG
jgi:LacI family transcriptional regulator